MTTRNGHEHVIRKRCPVRGCRERVHMTADPLVQDCECHGKRQTTHYECGFGHRVAVTIQITPGTQT